MQTINRSGDSKVACAISGIFAFVEMYVGMSIGSVDNCFVSVVIGMHSTEIQKRIHCCWDSSSI